MKKQEFRRVMVTRNGWAVVPAMTDGEARKAIKQLGESDFDWEPMDNGFLDDVEVMEECGEFEEDI